MVYRIETNNLIESTSRRAPVKPLAEAVTAKMLENPVDGLDSLQRKAAVATEENLKLHAAEFLYNQTESALKAELAKPASNSEKLFELFCRLQILMNRMTQNEAKDWVKELTRKLKTEVSLQIESKATNTVQGGLYTGAAVKLASAPLLFFNQPLGSAVSAASDAISSVAHTKKESNSTKETRHQFNVEEFRRVRDDSHGNKSQAFNNNSEILQLYQSAMKSLHDAKISVA